MDLSFQIYMGKLGANCSIDNVPAIGKLSIKLKKLKRATRNTKPDLAIFESNLQTWVGFIMEAKLAV